MATLSLFSIDFNGECVLATKIKVLNISADGLLKREIRDILR